MEDDERIIEIVLDEKDYLRQVKAESEWEDDPFGLGNNWR